MKKKFQIFGILLTMFIAVTIGGCSCSEDPKDAVNPTSIEILNKNSIRTDYHIGETFTLTYVIGPSGVTRNEVTASVSTGGVVELSQTLFEKYTGYRDTLSVETIAEGQTIITFTTRSGEFQDSITINVTDPKAIDLVTGIEFSEDKLTWNAVENASKYEVCIYKATDDLTATPISKEFSDTTSYTIPSTLPRGVEYVATVQAIGQGEHSKYLDGPVSAREANFFLMENITNITKNQYVASWSSVAHASSYDIKIRYMKTDDTEYSEYSTNQTATSFDLSTLGKDISVYDIFVRAIKEESEELYIFDSAEFDDSYTATIEKLDSVQNIKVSNSTTEPRYESRLVWDSVSGATSYDININGNTYSSSTNSLDITDMNLVTNTNYLTTIVAKANDKVTSEVSSFTFTVMPNITLASISDSKLTFTGVAGQDVTNYVVYFEKGSNEIVKAPTLSTSIDLTNLPSGSYKVYVKTLTSSSNIVNGAKYDTELTFTVLDEAQVTKVTNSNSVGDNNVATILDESGILTWSEVSGAESYEIVITKGGAESATIVCASTTYDLSSLTSPLESGSYNVLICAIGDGVNYLSSSKQGTGFDFSVLGSVDKESVTYNGTTNTISWNAVSGASEYIVYDGANYYHVAENKFSPVTAVVGQNPIQIIAMGNNQNVLNSSISQVFNFTKLSSPSGLTYLNGKLNFEFSVSGTVTYLLSLDNGETLFDITNLVTSEEGQYQADLSTIVTTSGEHVVKLKVRISGAMDSDFSDELTVTKLSTVNDLSVANGDTNTISFSVVNNAVAYEITTRFVGSETKQVSILNEGIVLTSDGLNDYTSNGTITLPLVSGLESGSYTVSIRAIGDTFISSDVDSHYTFYKLSSAQAQVSNGKVVWTESVVGSLRATSYLVSIDGSDYVSVTGTTYQGAMDSGAHTIRVKAITTQTDVLYSEETTFQFEKIANVQNIRVQDGVIVWDSLGEYTYHVLNGDNVLFTTTETTATYNYVVGEYMDIYVYATSNGYVDGDKNATALQVAKLPSVTGISVENRTLTWSQVSLSENGTAKEVATAYRVYKVLSDNSLSFMSEIPATGLTEYSYDIMDTVSGSYTYVVYAVGSVSETSIGYISSNQSVKTKVTVLDTVNVETFSVIDNALSWTAVTTDGKTPNSYKLNIYVMDNDGELEVSGKKYKFVETITIQNNQYNFAKYEGNTYLVNVESIGNGLEVFDSIRSENYVVTKIETPDLYVVDGVITWTQPSNVEDVTYVLTIGGIEHILTSSETSFVSPLLQAGLTQDYTIFARKSNYISSNVSNTIFAQRLSAVQNFEFNYQYSADNTITSMYLSWDKVENATRYKISISVNGEVQTETVSNDYFELPFANPIEVSANVSFNIVAYGGNTSDNTLGYLNSVPSREIKVITLDKVEAVTLKNGVVNWTTVENATNYLVEVKDKQGLTVYHEYTAQNFCDFEILSNGTYDISVTARGGNVGDNIYLHCSTPTKLENVIKGSALSDISLESGYIVWQLTQYQVNPIFDGVRFDITNSQGETTNTQLSGISALVKFAEIITKSINNEGLIASEQTVYDRGSHLIYVEVAYQLKSSASEIRDSYTLETDVAPMEVKVDGSVIKVYYNFDKPSGYYDIKIRPRGNSSSENEEEETYQLYLDGEYSPVINAYKSLAPQAPKPATADGEYTSYFVYGNNVFWNRVYYTNLDGITKETRYIIEISYTREGRVRQHKMFIELDSEYITNPNTTFGSDYAVVPFSDIADEFGLEPGIQYTLTVRVEGSTGVITNSDTVALVSAHDTYSKVNYVKTVTPTIDDGDLKFTTSGAGTEYAIIRIYNQDGTVISEELRKKLIIEHYGDRILDEDGNISKALVESYLIDDGMKFESSISSLPTELLATNNIYSVSIQEIGNGSTTIDSVESDKAQFVGLKNNISDLNVSDGNFVWSTEKATRIKIYSTIDGGETVVDETFGQKLVQKKSVESLETSSYVLPNDLPAVDSDGNVIYYTIAVALHPVTNQKEIPEITSDFITLSTWHRRLDSPTFNKTDDGLVYWNKVVNAQGYKVYINQLEVESPDESEDKEETEKFIPVHTETGGDQAFIDLSDSFDADGNNIFPSGTYNITISAIHPAVVANTTGFLTSNSIVVTIEKLKQATLSMTDGQINWAIEAMDGVEASEVELKLYEGKYNGSDNATPVYTGMFDPYITGIDINEYYEVDPNATYTIAVRLLTNSEKGIDGQVSFMTFTALDTPEIVWEKIDDIDPTLEEPIVVWDRITNAVGYRITAIASGVSKYVIDYRTLGNVVVGVTYSRYTLEDENWIVNKLNESFDISKLFYDNGRWNFMTNSLTTIISSDVTEYEMFVQALGTTSTFEDAGLVNYYTISKPSNSVDKVIPAVPADLEAGSSTGLVTWTNTTTNTTPTIKLVYRLGLNDTNNTLEKILARLQGRTYEIEYDTNSEATATQVIVTETIRLSKNQTSYRLNQVAYYTSISVLSESDDFTKSDYCSPIAVQFNAFADGDGSEENPYIIYNYNQLNSVRYYTSEGTYFKVEQAANSDNTIVIPSDWVSVSEFAGSIDFGSDTMTIINNFDKELFSINNGTIANLKMTVTISSALSSWSTLIAETNAGTITNIDISITAGKSTQTDYYNISTSRFMVVTNVNSGTISQVKLTMNNVNVRFNGSYNNSNYISLLAQENTGTISDAIVTGQLSIRCINILPYISMVYSNAYNAQVTGLINEADIAVVANNNNVTVSMSGIVYSNYGTISQSAFIGTLTGRDTNMAGIALNNYGLIEQCYNTGSFALTSLLGSKTAVIGGLVGTMHVATDTATYTPSLVNSYVMMKGLSLTVSNGATIRFGGLVSIIQNGSTLATISGSYAMVDTITLSSNIGGTQTTFTAGMLIGQMTGTNLSSSNLYYDTNATITSAIGQGTLSTATAITLKTSESAVSDNLNTLKTTLNQTAFDLITVETLGEEDGYSRNYSYYKLSFQE